MSGWMDRIDREDGSRAAADGRTDGRTDCLLRTYKLVLGVRSDKNQRNFENFAQNFSPLGRIRTLLPPELEIFSGVRATLRDSSWT